MYLDLYESRENHVTIVGHAYMCMCLMTENGEGINILLDDDRIMEEAADFDMPITWIVL